jgi:murein L,D-transpeptidase YcbB/YkuD
LKFRILATLSVLLLSAPSALGVQRALAPTRGDAAGWLAAVGIELAYLSLAFAAFADQRRQRLAARVARAAVLTAIVLNVLADYAARVPEGLSSAAQFLTTFDWLLLMLSVLESAPLATLAYTLATLLHGSAQQHTADAARHTADAAQHMLQQHQQHQQHHTAEHQHQHQQHSADAVEHMLQHTAEHQHQHQQQHQQQRAALPYRCPRCDAVLTQQQYGAARRYGYCGKCKGK